MADATETALLMSHLMLASNARCR